jgi:transcriptional regulator with XRE-family HTH domain
VLQTVGEQIRHYRLQRKRGQRKTASLLKVNPSTLLRWETRRAEPPIGFAPVVFGFLRYDPFSPHFAHQWAARAVTREAQGDGLTTT